MLIGGIMKQLSLLLLLFFLAIACIAQTPERDTLDIKKLYQIYNVPELPAFAAIGLDPSSIVTPVSDNALSLYLSDFVSDKPYVPTSLAAEIAPVQLLMRKITLATYKKCPVFFNSRISVASSKKEDEPMKAAFGVRLKLVDKGDLKRDNVLWDKFFDDYSKKRDEYMSKLSYVPDTTGVIGEAQLADFDREYGTNARLRTIIDNLADSSWNQLKIEASFAVVGITPDSLIQDMKFNCLQAWFSISNSADSTIVQYILCPSGQYYRESREDYFKLYAPGRLLIKLPILTAYSELQYTFDNANSEHAWNATLGGFFEMYKGFWLDFQISYSDDFKLKSSNLDTNFKIKFGLPSYLNI
jgi:hypothetical protein